MKKLHIIALLFLLPLLASCSDQKQVYVVYFGEHNGEKAHHEIEDTHHSYLLSVKKTEEEARASLLYSYKHSINGFAALLTPLQASKLSELEEVVSVSKSEPDRYSMHTTRSWEFSGLEEDERLGSTTSLLHMGGDLLSKAKYGKEVIVGILDSGVWPESKSFNDEGMGPVPKSWKGICQTGTAFNSSHCNRKIIGARYYLKGYEQFYGSLNTSEDYRSARDKDGHGTHTASTVAGRSVPGVSALGGFAYGTASGGAPLARLAIYKVCWPIPGRQKIEGNACFMEDMLAAMDDAIADGVHVMSISIGTSKPFNYTDDGIAIGALHAAKNNIVVSCSAGNSGPGPGTLSNPAPWILTVGASSLDREFPGPILLGNGQKVMGQTVTPSKLKKKMYPLAYAADVAKPGESRDKARVCLEGSLSPEKAKGKIILCMRGNNSRVAKGFVVKEAGGAGYILGNTPESGGGLPCDAHLLPATAMTYNNAMKVLKYIYSTKNPRAFILPAKTKLHTKPAPFMAGFTSRGPNVIEPNILKPDITAPGLNILAAWTEGDSPTKISSDIDPRVVKYNILSGTSMSCPHVAAASVLLKAIHPTWSSAAIRSALMTTAGLRNNLGKPLTDESGSLANSFAYGSGHFRPAKAAYPGLVYDASYTDYLLHLCSTGAKGVDKSFKCPENPPTAINLNYPSLAVSKLNGTVTVNRTVTNVGKHKSVYFFSSRPPLGFSVEASPSILSFDYVGQKKSFTITVKARSETLESKNDTKEYAFGWYSWLDGLHVVRSPIAVSLA
ncbi:Subtilase [Parasponia andersonii]|uniref:Subtilase n=1 Tax=Parasponia andersonii TaxID=3476 RepID=A0A2P5C0W1_PARAD|nr:Subtilase [Parasponia andersonii]